MFPYAYVEAVSAGLAPFRLWNEGLRLAAGLSPLPLVAPDVANAISANCTMFERLTRRYAKPRFGIAETRVGDDLFAVTEREAWSSPFCRLVRFEKSAGPRTRAAAPPPQPRLLLVAPLSGHHATLLRGTVEALLPGCDVHVTDWVDARLVPPSAGRFDLDDYVDHVAAMLRRLGPGTHVMAVCQPSVPVLMATALMEADRDPCAPASMTLLGGPIDTRVSPTAVNRLATERGIDWFRDNAIATVPCPNPGAGRRVYPGLAQLAGFVSMNLDRHVEAHRAMHAEIARGDRDAAARRTAFYDEYLAVLDLTEEFYLQTVQRIFVDHDLPLGRMRHRGRLVDPSAIRNAGLMTVEGENDDITGVGQTEAAHGLCPNVPAALRVHHLQPGVGHYGTFSGSRFVAEIAPRILAFIASVDRGVDLPLAA